METQHKELDLGKLDSRPQRTHVKLRGISERTYYSLQTTAAKRRLLVSLVASLMLMSASDGVKNLPPRISRPAAALVVDWPMLLEVRVRVRWRPDAAVLEDLQDARWDCFTSPAPPSARAPTPPSPIDLRRRLLGSSGSNSPRFGRDKLYHVVRPLQKDIFYITR